MSFDEELTRSPEEPLVTSERQLRALQRAATELKSFIGGIEKGLPSELAVIHLRTAAQELEELIGVVTPDDVLDTLFERFCVGK